MLRSQDALDAPLFDLNLKGSAFRSPVFSTISMHSHTLSMDIMCLYIYICNMYVYIYESYSHVQHKFRENLWHTMAYDNTCAKGGNVTHKALHVDNVFFPEDILLWHGLLLAKPL